MSIQLFILIFFIDNQKRNKSQPNNSDPYLFTEKLYD